MSNHYHLIVTTPDANISRCMHQFAGRSSRRLTRAGNRINETYAGRHYKCVLNSETYFLNAYKYIYRNPVTAGICDRVENYAFSTVNTLTDGSPSGVEICEDLILKKDPIGTLLWLNTTPDPTKLEGVRYALKRPVFRSKKFPTTNLPMIGENDIL